VTNVGNLTISNTSSTVTLSSPISLTGVLTLNSGKLVLANNTLSLTNASPGAMVDGSNGAHVVTGDPFLVPATNGRLSRAISSISLPGTYIFPVGNNSSYMPMTLTFTANSEPRAVTVVAVNSTQAAVTSFPSYLANRYWRTNLTVSAGTYSYSAVFEFPSADVVGGFAALRLYYNPTSATPWTDVGSIPTSTSLSSSPLSNATASLASATWTAKGTTSGTSPQTITFNSLSAATYGDANIALGATASSGLAVTYTSSNSRT
jgi:hypothetical protein